MRHNLGKVTIVMIEKRNNLQTKDSVSTNENLFAMLSGEAEIAQTCATVRANSAGRSELASV